MHFRSAAVALLALAACSRSNPGDEETDGSTSASETGAASTGDEGSPSTSGGDGSSEAGSEGASTSGESTSTDGSNSSAGSTGVEMSSTGSEPFCGDGALDDGEECDDGNSWNSDGCTDACTLPICGDDIVQAGEECDDGTLSNEDNCAACKWATCGDGFVQAGVEECDGGEGCTGCLFDRWEHEGVAHDVPVADLHRWEPCWSYTYEAGDLVTNLLEGCHGDHVLLGCRLVGSDTLTLAAHAARDDVFFEPQVNYDDGERHAANGVNWYYAPYYGNIGFAAADDFLQCEYDGSVGQMCWWTGGNEPQMFAGGHRCGTTVVNSIVEKMTWERVAFHAWD